MSDNDKVIQEFESCTGIEDTEEARQYLIKAEWDLLKAVMLAMPERTQKLPSESMTNDVAMEDVSNQPSVSNFVSFSDDYYSPPSTSNSRIRFNIYNEDSDCSHSVDLSDNDTIDHLKQAIFAKWGTPPCQQSITGWLDKTPGKDNEPLKNLNLPPSVQLSMNTSVASRAKKTINGVNDTSKPNNDGEYVLRIFDEVHSKEHLLQFPASKKVWDVKNDMYHCSEIPVKLQVWAGWPQSYTSDDLTLGQLGLTVPIHELSFRSAPVLVSSNSRKKRNNRVPSLDSDSDASYSSNEDEDMQSVIADDLFEEDVPSKNCSCPSLVPEDFEDETTGCIQFAVSFQEKYGIIHPDFFPGTLGEAFKEACFKPAKDRKLLAVYLHHDKSILTNVFCSQLLCVESVLQYLSEHFVVWGWDVTLDSNKTFLLGTMHTVLGKEAALTVRSLKTDNYPVILIITRVRRNTEILAVIHNVGVNELLSQLIQVVDIFTEQQGIECKEEEQRAAREMIKVEQDEAYQQSLEVDRAKLEAKRKQEQLEIEEQAKIENARMKAAAKKEAHRRVLESKLPPEPEDGVEGITKIRVRIQQNQVLERKFLKTDTLEMLLDFLVVRGYDIGEYKLITSFPRRDLTTMNKTSTFEELKLFPQETLILEER